MGRRLDIPWLEVDIPWVGVDIPCIGGQNYLGRGLIYHGYRGSIYHG